MIMPRCFAPLLVGLILASPAMAADSPSNVAGATTVPAKAAWIPKLGQIKPSGPFRLWTAINKVLPQYASLKGGKGLKSQVEGVPAEKFEGMSPGDVMAQTAEFRAMLKTLRAPLKLAKIKTYEDPLGRKVTPAIVFINAGHILDAVVQTFYVSSNKSYTALGEFYQVPFVAGKKSDDVFALVYLATRRLRLIAGS